MILHRKKFILNLFSFLIIIFVVAAWSTSLLVDWGSDYSSYYTGSYFLSNNYNLYQEYFDHKGPLYYLFLKIIGYVIGWGHWQAYLSLILTMLVFYIPVFYILVSERLEPMTFFAGTLLSLCLLYGQPTNVSISFFQSGFLLTSFWLAVKNRKSFIRQSISFSLFICAVLIRIDAVIFFPIYLATLMITNYPSPIIAYAKKLSIWVVIFTIFFWALSYNLNFTINDFLVHNIEFNKWYREFNLSTSSSLFYKFAQVIIRPVSYQLFTNTLIIIPLLILLPQLMSSFGEVVSYLKKIIQKKIPKKSMSPNAFAMIIVFIGATGWFLTFSDKNYHLIILLVPLLFFYLINFHFFSVGQSSFIVLTALYCLVITLNLPLYKLSKDPECLYSSFCNSSQKNNYLDTINFLRDLPGEEITILGGHGWLYFHSNKKPAASISNWVLYYPDNPFLAPELIKQHQNLLKMSPGFSFLITNDWLDRVKKNIFLDEVLSKAELVTRLNKYSVFQIR